MDEKIFKFPSLVQARLFAALESRSMSVVRGDDHLYWVVSNALADLLLAQGFGVLR